MNKTNNDIELIERLSKGDLEAFDPIYSKYSGTLYAFGLKYLRSADDAEELVQSVFLKIWENHKNLKKELSFRSYLFTITYNDICKIFRTRKCLEKFISDYLHEVSRSSARTEEEIDFGSVVDYVKKIIDKLPERQKTIFEKSRIEGKSTKEIALELGLTPGTIDNYISKSIRFIREKVSSKDLYLLLLFLFLF